VPFEVRKSATFETWVKDLADPVAREAIAIRVERVGYGLFGDRRSVGAKVGELRVDAGRGYRLYYTMLGRATVLLLCGGIKQTQKADIRKAKAMAREAVEEKGSGGRVRERRAGYAAEADEPLLAEADLTFSPFDVADYIESDSSQVALLRDAVASGHAEYIANAVGAVARARARRERETGNKRRTRKKSPSLKDAPTVETLTTVLEALGLRLEVVEKGQVG
jgi:putative addiction module killer protein/probable addiction module antidote protein